MICQHCAESLRRDGLVIVAVIDDLSACPAAPLERCSRCQGKGCSSCEGYGELYGRHVPRA